MELEYDFNEEDIGYKEGESYEYNQYEYKNNYIILHVNNTDKVFLIDREYEEYARLHTWFAHKRIVNGNDFDCLLMKEKIGDEWVKFKYHQVIMEIEIKKYKETHDYDKQIIVDHINGNSRDNRKHNLRVRTQSENNMNKQIQINNTTGIVGVGWHIRDKIWCASISVDNKQITLGSFYYLRNAVKARVEAEDKYFGEHAFRLRDLEYNNYINEILELPKIKEPYIRERPRNEFGRVGITRVNLKNKSRFLGRIYVKGSKDIHKTFDILEDCIKWRENKEIEFYSLPILYDDQKEEKLI